MTMSKKNDKFRKFNNRNKKYNKATLTVVKTEENEKLNQFGTKTETKTNTTPTTTGKTSGYYYKSATKNYNFQGRKNETNFYQFVNLCLPTQKELKKILEEKLLDMDYTEVVSGDGYVYAKGTVPVLLTAHMDTVHKEPVKDFYEYFDENKNQHIISSPQGIGGDDRCGIYMILEIIKEHKCSVLFCEDEETGGIGGRKFCKTEMIDDLKNMKYLIELDRKGSVDAVFYDCENDDFTDFIEKNTGFKENYGSFSDISNLSPACKVASVNLSCGYYNAHTTSEYVIVEEMLNTIEVVKKLLTVECEQFEYIEKKHIYSYGRGYSGYGYNYDYDYGYGYYGSYYSSKNKTHSANTYSNNSRNDDDYWEGYQDGYYDALEEKDMKDSQEDETSMLIMVWSEQKNDTISYISNGKSEAEAIGNFLIKNPEYCFKDIYDYEMSETKICEDGWLGY